MNVTFIKVSEVVRDVSKKSAAPPLVWPPYFHHVILASCLFFIHLLDGQLFNLEATRQTNLIFFSITSRGSYWLIKTIQTFF